MNFYVICYIVNLIVSICAFFATFVVIKSGKGGMQILPRGLRLYLQYCCFPYAAVINLASIYCCIYYLIFRTETPFSFSIFKTIVAFASQQVRNAFFAVVIERIIATVYFQSYNFSSKLCLFYLLSIFSYLISLLYLLYLVLGRYIPSLFGFQKYTYWFVFSEHVITLAVCSILHLINKRMYEISIYQISLKQRHQIFENVKVLIFIFPSIVIFTSIAPFGSLATLLMQSIYKYTAPFSIFHLAYNLSFLIISVRCLILNKSISAKNQISSTVKTIVVNPFGKQLAGTATVETHFKDLKRLWA